MEENKLTLGIGANNNYKKAKQDLIQTIWSIQKLSLKQQQILAKESFEAANVMILS